MNPAFAKRSADGSAASEYGMDRRALHASTQSREFLKGDSLENVGFHRRGRATLYQQIEGLLQAWVFQCYDFTCFDTENRCICLSS